MSNKAKSKAEENKSNVVTFRLAELFCGPGGLACGAKMARVFKGQKRYRITHAWATDYDESTCETYAQNITSGNRNTVICEDIRKADLDKLAATSPFDALAFGFPCNDFSQVGKQKGFDGTFGPLYQYGVEVLRRNQPQWFLAENVGGLQTANEGRAFDVILDAMFDAGYDIYPNLYKFEEYGVPQARHRVIIVGIRKDLNLEFKIPSTEPFRNVDVSCRTAIEGPPIGPDALNNEITRQSDVVVQRLGYIHPGENAFDAEHRMPEAIKLHVQGAKISQIYKRLDPDRPAYTVTGSGGGGTHMYHWEKPRALTNRERARLQTFPDDFEFMGSKEEVRGQIGMAVPCRGAKVIFEAILKTFAGIKYPSMDSNLPGRSRCHVD